MRSLEITFHRHIKPEREKAILDQINGWDSIVKADYLMPESSDENIRSMAYAYIRDGAAIEAVSKRLEAMPEIETAPVPPKRSFGGGAD